MDAPIYDLRGVPFDRDWLARAADQTGAFSDSLVVKTFSASGQDAEHQDPDIDRLHSGVEVHLNAEGGQLAHPTVGEANLNDR